MLLPGPASRLHCTERASQSGFKPFRGRIFPKEDGRTFHQILVLGRKIGDQEEGNIALLHAQWHLTGTGPDGQPVALSGRTAEVVQQQPDGRWLYLIDNPHGSE